jgi:hypothetical protein
MLPEVQITGPPALQYGTSPNRIALHSAACLEMPLPCSVGYANIHLRPHFPSTVHLHFTTSHLTYPIRSRKASRRCCVPLRKYLLVLLSFEFLSLEPVERKENSELQALSPLEAQLLHRTNNACFRYPRFHRERASKQGNTKGSKGGSEYVSKSWLISPLLSFFFLVV